MRVLVLSDNPLVCDRFKEVAQKHALPDVTFDYASSSELEKGYAYPLVVSAHCKRIFPPSLVRAVRCLNLHPGLNPHNRGWFPHVFSMVNHKPCGATIHIIDEKIDHGPILYQQEVHIKPWHTSQEVYAAIIEAEITLLDAHFEELIFERYTPYTPSSSGNLNTKADFAALCHLDLEEHLTMREALDKLRALTHGDLKGAYFLDEDGKKIYCRLNLAKE